MGMVFSAPRTRTSHKAICKKSGFDFDFQYPEYKKKCDRKKIRKTVTLDNDMYTGFIEYFLFTRMLSVM